MKLRIDGKTVDAVIDTHYADTRIGHAVVVLDGEVIVEPRFASIHGYSIVEATMAERQLLNAAGYDLPDWKGE